MSTSKKRRKARKWMQREKEKHAAELQCLSDRAYGWVSEARAEERERLTSVFAPKDDDTVELLGRPSSIIYKIPKRYAVPDSLRYPPRHVEVYTLHVEQHALVLPDGTKVIWYGLRR